MANSNPTQTYSGSIPYSGSLTQGLVLLVSTAAEGSVTLFASAIYDSSKWHFGEAFYPGSSASTGVYLTSVSVSNGKIRWSGYATSHWGAAVVIQTDGLAAD
jgi:hypothetical protein|nr:MAG TPA: hypothetical protein [Caudoviricetes sp.]